jgi:hypothetical protein
VGKKPQRRTWPEAKKLCRLNQNDIEMAKRLSFGPDSLMRARPDPKQRWKLPVNLWIRERYRKKFGHLLGEKLLSEKPLPAPLRTWAELDEDERQRIDEQFFWEDYFARNEEPPLKGRKKSVGQPFPAAGADVRRAGETFRAEDDFAWHEEFSTRPADTLSDDDVPF